MTGALQNKNYRGLLDELKEQGWELASTGQNHWKATPPDSFKKSVVFSESRDFHAYLNTIRTLQDQGFKWPPPSKAEAKSQRRREQSDGAEVVPIVRASPFPPVPMEITPAVTAPETPPALVDSTSQCEPFERATNKQAVCAVHSMAEVAKRNHLDADKLFELLKIARDLEHLAHMEMQMAERATMLASEKFATARKEHEELAEALRVAKRAFDEAFEVVS